MTLLAALLIAFSPAGGNTASAHGLRMWIPPGWRVETRRHTNCTNPIERLTLTGPGGGMVHLQESLDAPRYIRRFSPRPRTFVLRGRPSPLACCPPTHRAGWLVQFRDGGRGFYAYVYGATPTARRYARQALGSLIVEPRA